MQLEMQLGTPQRMLVKSFTLHATGAGKLTELECLYTALLTVGNSRRKLKEDGGAVLE
jgi:hypothetical protein